MNRYQVRIYDAERANYATIIVESADMLMAAMVESAARKALYSVRNDVLESRASYEIEKVD
jgi:hypothetical protein